ncbi:MAG: hypothetical protein M0T75_07750 [Chloroflexi bacterium]|nr:hypothetical protein [Chloroflexota bacterium]
MAPLAVTIYSVPFSLPGLVLAALVGLLASRPLGRALGAHPIVAWAIVASVGLILAATLTPVPGADDPARGGLACDLSRIGLAPWRRLTSVNEVSLNILLLVPLGLALGLLPRSRPKVGLVAAAAALPLAIEVAQAVATPLHRACQSADVFDNLTGLALGLLAGGAAGALDARRAPAARG